MKTETSLNKNAGLRSCRLITFLKQGHLIFCFLNTVFIKCGIFFGGYTRFISCVSLRFLRDQRSLYCGDAVLLQRFLQINRLPYFNLLKPQLFAIIWTG